MFVFYTRELARHAEELRTHPLDPKCRGGRRAKLDVVPPLHVVDRDRPKTMQIAAPTAVSIHGATILMTRRAEAHRSRRTPAALTNVLVLVLLLVLVLVLVY